MALFSKTEIVNPAQIMTDEDIRTDDVVLCELCFRTPLEGIIWLAKRKLLRNSYRCTACDVQMTCCQNRRVVQDGYQWICRLCKKSRSVRIDSFAFGSHLALQQIIVLVYGWAMEFPQHIIAREARLGDGQHTVTDWFKFCRDVCEFYFIENKTVIGGLNEDGTSKTVEIDESKFFHRKYHRGRWLDGHWVFGGIERGTKKCFLVEVPDRTEATFAEIIKRHILPGTIIVSDSRRAYNDINTICGGIYEHEVVIHEDNSVDQEDPDIHTRNVGNMWMRAKRKLRRKFGTSEALFTSYMHDFAWRNQFPMNQVFPEFLATIVAQYPLR